MKRIKTCIAGAAALLLVAASLQLAEEGQADDLIALWATVLFIGGTVTWSAWSAMIGIDWIPDEPVPITATRLPVKSTSSCGHRPVKYTSPA